MIDHNLPLSQLTILSALREIARALSAAWDLDSTLDLITRKTSEVMKVDSCSLYLLDTDNSTLRLRASTGLSQKVVGRTTLKIGEGMTGIAVAQNIPIYSSNAPADPRFKLVDPSEEGLFQSLLAVPLSIRQQEKPIGAMNVQTRTSHTFSEYEIEILQLIGDLAAGALAKAQMIDRQTQQLDEMEALATVSEVMTSPQFLDDILDVVTDMAARTMDASVCALFLLNEAGTHLELRSAKRTSGTYSYRKPLPVGEGIIGQVVESGRFYYVSDVRVHPEYIGTELAIKEGLVSLLCVPLMVRDRVIGVLNCYTSEERFFTNEQRALFSTLANQTALAIENSRLLTNTAVMREMHHRIKNNLQTIAMLMELQIPDADRLDTRQVLETNIHRVRSIATVHEVLSERGFRMVDVNDVVRRITQATRDALTIPGQAIEIHVSGVSLPLPSQAATSLTLVVNELVQNALEHAFVDQKDGRIDVSLGRTKKEIVVSVRDNGQGMPADHRRGLGLEISETLVKTDLGGTIRFKKNEPKGTAVSIRLPRKLEQLPEAS